MQQPHLQLWLIELEARSPPPRPQAVHSVTVQVTDILLGGSDVSGGHVSGLDYCVTFIEFIRSDA